MFNDTDTIFAITPSLIEGILADMNKLARRYGDKLWVKDNKVRTIASTVFDKTYYAQDVKREE